jgi:hypothetical protein
MYEKVGGLAEDLEKSGGVRPWQNIKGKKLKRFCDHLSVSCFSTDWFHQQECQCTLHNYLGGI